MPVRTKDEGMDLDSVQRRLQDAGLDGWLFYDFHLCNPIAYEVLGISLAIASRRWFYWVPRHGAPLRIVSAVEPKSLDRLPGDISIYRTWRELHGALRQALDGSKTVAMEYSPKCDLPYLSRVDAGTVELVEALGVEVVSSAQLAQVEVSVLTPTQLDSHREAGRLMLEAKDQLFEELSSALRQGDIPDEFGTQQRFVELMEAAGLQVDEAPIVAVDSHAGNPHHETTRATSLPIVRGSLILFDFWAKLPGERSIFADYTWMAFAGSAGDIPGEITRAFSVIVEARDVGIALMQERRRSGTPISGGEVDDAVRAVIEAAGHGDAFLHRTGHSITTVVHGNGAHLDNFETADKRELLANTCNSVEPGIYLAEFGVRTETDTIILDDNVEVTGGQLQQEIAALL